MRYYGRAEEVAQRILTAFQASDIPAKLAWIFLKQGHDIPCRRWSFANQLMVALMGHDDARGFRQWQDVGRKVKKGEKGFPILVPITRKSKTEDEKTGEETERICVLGFKHAVVFGYDQTEGEALEYQLRNEQFIAGLPLIDVARDWGLHVQIDPTLLQRGAAGTYSGAGIKLAVGNQLTWAHELIHAADERKRGKLTAGQQWDQEIVAELGGAVLLECLGFSQESNRGHVWEYTEQYASEAELEPIEACQKLLKRTCEAVALVLETTDKLQQQSAAA